MDNEIYIFKTITMGDANSGKTLLCQRLCKQREDLHYSATIGIEFNSINFKYNDKYIKLQLWDTAGQECFAPVVRSYYKNILGIFFVIDLTSQRSINNIDFWLEEFNNHRSQNCETIIIALGNKIDRKDRIISYEKIKSIFDKKNIDYFEISAKNNENVMESRDFFLNKVFKTIDINNHKGIHFRNLEKDMISVKHRDSCAYLCEDQQSCCVIN
tara:strand:+ start:1582 stop:2223 length:642 start_codon:yes stop_codon:yes gene_type:complete